MKTRDFQRILTKLGYKITRYSGSHAIWTKDGHHVSVPQRQEINRMLARRLLKELGEDYEQA